MTVSGRTSFKSITVGRPALGNISRNILITIQKQIKTGMVPTRDNVRTRDKVRTRDRVPTRDNIMSLVGTVSLVGTFEFILLSLVRTCVPSSNFVPSWNLESKETINGAFCTP